MFLNNDMKGELNEQQEDPFEHKPCSSPRPKNASCIDYSKFAKPILIQLFWIIILGFGLYKGVKGSFRYHSIKQLINK